MTNVFMDLEHYPGPPEDSGIHTKFISDDEIALNMYTHNPARAMLSFHAGEMLYRLTRDMDYEPLGIVLNAFPRSDGYTVRYRSDSGA